MTVASGSRTLKVGLMLPQTEGSEGRGGGVGGGEGDGVAGGAGGV